MYYVLQTCSKMATGEVTTIKGWAADMSSLKNAILVSKSSISVIG